MASKTITISDAVYDLLERRKRGGESFTMVISRLLEEKKRPSDMAGAWSDLTPEENRSIEKARKQLRSSWKARRNR
jgi:predicted CopG family antitoxin